MIEALNHPDAHSLIDLIDDCRSGHDGDTRNAAEIADAIGQLRALGFSDAAHCMEA